MELPFVWQSHSPKDTARFGLLLGELVPAGLTVALNGELGSGKTQLVRAFCKGLGVDTDQVNSPTFVLMQVYTGGRLPVFHFDTYRLGDFDEFLSIGAGEYLHDENSVCVIEWAETVEQVLPADRMTISLRQTGPESREFEINGGGDTSRNTVQKLVDALCTE